MEQIKVFKSSDVVPFLIMLVDEFSEDHHGAIVATYDGITVRIDDWDYYHVFDLENF